MFFLTILSVKFQPLSCGEYYPGRDLELLKDCPRQIQGMKRLSSTDIEFEKKLSGPIVMSCTLAGTETTILEIDWN